MRGTNQELFPSSLSFRALEVYLQLPSGWKARRKDDLRHQKYHFTTHPEYERPRVGSSQYEMVLDHKQTDNA